jgi:hypothetical protein
MAMLVIRYNFSVLACCGKKNLATLGQISLFCSRKSAFTGSALPLLEATAIELTGAGHQTSARRSPPRAAQAGWATPGQRAARESCSKFLLISFGRKIYGGRNFHRGPIF